MRRLACNTCTGSGNRHTWIEFHPKSRLLAGEFPTWKKPRLMEIDDAQVEMAIRTTPARAAFVEVQQHVEACCVEHRLCDKDTRLRRSNRKRFGERQRTG